MSDIAMIGDRDAVLLARAGGMEAHAVSTPEYAAKLIKKLAHEGTKIIFLTEQLYAQCSAVLAQYDKEPFPAIIPVPDSHGTSGVAMNALRANVEKAIGVDILFGGE